MRYVNLDGGQFFGPPPPSQGLGGMSLVSGTLLAFAGSVFYVQGSLTITGTGELIVSPGAEVLISP